MPRIPEALIESIKRDVGCVAVLEARGLLITHISGQQNSALLISHCSDNPVAWGDLYALGSRGIRTG